MAARPRSILVKDQSWTVMLPSSEATGSPLTAIGNDSLPLVSKQLDPTCIEFNSALLL